MVLRIVALIWLIGATSSALVQEAFSDGLPRKENFASTQSTAENAWIDLRQHPSAASRPQSAPSWVEAVNMTSATGMDGAPRTVFRIRVAPPAGDYQVMFFRLFFEDNANTRPEIVAWDESGSQVLRSGELGSGVGLPTSDSVMIPMSGISTLDIEVPGDGKTIRGAYLDWMTSSQVVHPVNAEHRDVIPEPFSLVPALHAPPEDVENFGTVTATLAPDPIRVDGQTQESAVFQFPIEAQPLTALLTFEIANPSVDAPPEIYLNGQDIGPVSLTLPDLADPGYRGEAEPLTPEMHFHYTGWLRAQKIVPAAILKVGPNDLVVANGIGSGSSAIRATQVQLKYIWDKSDYLLRASH